jgi:hypothetical protein
MKYLKYFYNSDKYDNIIINEELYLDVLVEDIIIVH